MRRIFKPISNILLAVIIFGVIIGIIVSVVLGFALYWVLTSPYLDSENAEDDGDNEQIYYDINNGITIEYASDKWRILEIDDQTPGHISIAFKPQPIPFDRSQTANVDDFLFTPAALTVNVHNLSSNQNATLKDRMMIDVDILKNNSYTILLTNNTSYLSGNPAYELITNSSDGKFKTLQITTFKNNKMFTIIYQSSVDAYSLYLPSAKKIIDSLTIYLLGYLI